MSEIKIKIIDNGYLLTALDGKHYYDTPDKLKAKICECLNLQEEAT